MNTINPLVVTIKPNQATLISPIDPTMHKGGLGKILSVAAAIVVPIAAPTIASSIGLSQTIGAITSAGIGKTIGSAIVGAGLGAISAAVQGQDIRRGALTGGITSGVTGYLSPTPGVEGTATGVEGAAASPTTPPPVSQAALAQGAEYGFGAEAQQALAQQAGGAANASAAIARQSFTGILKDTGSAIADRFTQNPEQLASLTLEIAGELAGETLVPEGTMPALPPEMQDVYDARKAELLELKAMDREKYDQQIALSQQYLVNAGYLDPVYYGNQAANQVLIDRNRQERERLRKRGLTEFQTSTAGEDRRAGIDTARLRAAGFDQAFTKTAGQQRAAIDAGVKAIPDAPTTYSQGLREQYADYAAGLKTIYGGDPSAPADRAREGITETIGKLTGEAGTRTGAFDTPLPGEEKEDDGTYGLKLSKTGI